MDSYVIFFIEGGIGKHIASTAVVEGKSKNYPDKKIVVISQYKDIYLNNPNVYRTINADNSYYIYEDFIKNKNSIFLNGDPYFTNDFINGNSNLIESWFNLFNLSYRNEKPKIFLTDSEILNAEIKYKRNKENLIFQPNGGRGDVLKYDFNWVKDLPPKFAQELIDELSRKYNIFQFGILNNKIKYSNVEFLNIPLRESFALLKITEKKLLIDSYPQHACAALNTKAVVCWICTDMKKFGYESNININFDLKYNHYDTHIGLVQKYHPLGIPSQCCIDLKSSFKSNQILSYF